MISFIDMILLAGVSLRDYRYLLVITPTHPYVFLIWSYILAGCHITRPQISSCLSSCLSMGYISFIVIYRLDVTHSYCRYKLIVQLFTFINYTITHAYSCISCSCRYLQYVTSLRWRYHLVILQSLCEPFHLFVHIGCMLHILVPDTSSLSNRLPQIVLCMRNSFIY